jgi:hypothetical protein
MGYFKVEKDSTVTRLSGSAVAGSKKKKKKLKKNISLLKFRNKFLFQNINNEKKKKY